MRIAIAEIAQETDTFSPIRARLTDFESYGLYSGEEIPRRMHGVGSIGGFLEVVAEQEAAPVLIPILRAWGGAGGRITSPTLDLLLERLVTGLRAALPLDAVFLSLHGAAASDRGDDVEGEVLSAVRDVVGKEVPVVVPLDHHANVTQRMVDQASALIGHETQPHDPPATGRKAARILFRILRDRRLPTIAWRKIPMITPQDQFLTSSGPMKEWFDLARSLERREGVIDVSPYPMQPWLDVAEGGWSVVVHTDRDPELARNLADEMAGTAWRLRHAFMASERVAPAEAVRQGASAGAGMSAGMVLLSDTGDSVYGGAPGDNTCILREMVEQRISVIALVPMVDPDSLRSAVAAGVGAEVTLAIGGKMDHMFSHPLTVTGRVAAVSNGFTVDLLDRGICNLGQTALLEVGGIRIALLDHRSFAINHPVLYAHLGIDIQDARLVVLKTASNFQFFNRWRAGLIRVDSPGTTQSNLAAFRWQQVPRPIFPLDDLKVWSPCIRAD